MKRSRYCWLLLTAWCLLAGAGLAQEPPASLLGDEMNALLEQMSKDRDAFKLWNECAPIWLFVEEPPDDAADIGLTKERIQTLAESRLRVARLYGEMVVYSAPHLHVIVNMFVSENRRNGAFVINVSFKKDVLDDVSDQEGSVTTWKTGSYGIHTGDADYIMQAVSGHIDEFILEYLRVNETACR